MKQLIRFIRALIHNWRITTGGDLPGCSCQHEACCYLHVCKDEFCCDMKGWDNRYEDEEVPDTDINEVPAREWMFQKDDHSTSNHA